MLGIDTTDVLIIRLHCVGPAKSFEDMGAPGCMVPSKTVDIFVGGEAVGPLEEGCCCQSSSDGANRGLMLGLVYVGFSRSTLILGAAGAFIRPAIWMNWFEDRPAPGCMVPSENIDVEAGGDGCSSSSSDGANRGFVSGRVYVDFVRIILGAA